MKKLLVALLVAMMFVSGVAVADNSDPVSLSGSGTTITDSVRVDTYPRRFTFTQTEPGEFDVSCVLGGETYSIVDGNYLDTTGCVCIPRVGDYTFMIESASDWTIDIVQMVDVDFAPLSMHGDYVTDIYTFDKPVILDITAKFDDSDNFFVYAYVEERSGYWDKQYLANELKDAGGIVELSKILAIAKPTRVYFVIDFDEGDWTLDIKQ